MELSAEDHRLYSAVVSYDADAAAVQQAIRDGANVNTVSGGFTPLIAASKRGYDEIIRILLDAGADARWRNRIGWSAMSEACLSGHLSTVQLLINHDESLLEIEDQGGWTPLQYAIREEHSDIVRFLLDSGANPNCVLHSGITALMHACQFGRLVIVWLLLAAGADVEARDSLQQTAMHFAARHGYFDVVRELILQHNANIFAVDNHGWTPLIVAVKNKHSDIVEFLLDSGADPHHVDQAGVTTLMHMCQEGIDLVLVWLLLAAGVDVEAHDQRQQTALHYAARRGDIEVMRELILKHNANMFAANEDGRTPFDLACDSSWSRIVVNPLLELCGNKLTQEHGHLALHELLKAAEYSFAEDETFHPPLNPLRIILPLGNLTLKHLHTLLHTLDPELIRIRDDTGKVPIHIACHTNAPVEILAMILKLDQSPTAALRIADFTGALPIHLLFGNATEAAEYGSVRYLVEQGGVGTLAARNRQGHMPLHILCRFTNPPLRTVLYLMQSFPGSVAMQSNVGQYQLMMAAAADSSSASLTVIYELVRANPGLVVPE